MLIFKLINFHNKRKLVYYILSLGTKRIFDLEDRNSIFFFHVTNVLGVCGPDLRFIYVLPGWEGLAGDSRVLHHKNCLHIPNGNIMKMMKLYLSYKRNMHIFLYIIFF